MLQSTCREQHCLQYPNNNNLKNPYHPISRMQRGSFPAAWSPWTSCIIALVPLPLNPTNPAQLGQSFGVMAASSTLGSFYLCLFLSGLLIWEDISGMFLLNSDFLRINGLVDADGLEKKEKRKGGSEQGSINRKGRNHKATIIPPPPTPEHLLIAGTTFPCPL